MDLNAIALTGRLAQDPDPRQATSGAAVCRLKLANTLRRKYGEKWVEKTSFIDVEVWGAQAFVCAQSLVEGSFLAVVGEFEIDEWRDGESGALRTRPMIRNARVTFEASASAEGASPKLQSPGRPE